MRQRILVLLGFAVAALVLYTFVLRGRSGSPGPGLSAVAGQMRYAAAKSEVPAARPKAASPADTAAAKAPPVDGAALAPRALAPEVWGSDPFVRDWVMLNELANFNLKAITLGGERAYALINDQILQEGDVISGKRVVRIESDKVTLEQGGREFTLMLGE